MAIVKHTMLAGEAEFLATAFPQYDKVNGTNFPVSCLKFHADTDQQAFWRFKAQNYGAGNVTVNIDWYADTASSGDVIFTGALAAIQPNTDTQDIETKAFATANTVTDTHLGTTGQRLHLATITITNLDGLAADEEVYLRLTRDADNGSDTMLGAACVTLIELTYSDT